MSKQSVEKRKRRKKEREGKRKQRARKRAAEGHLTIGGRVEHNQCLADVTLANPTDASMTRRIPAIVDTGATATAIRSDIANQLNLPKIGMTQVATAGGQGTADVVAAYCHVDSDGSVRIGLWRLR